MPDLLIIDLATDSVAALALIEFLRGEQGQPDLPIVAICPRDQTATRIAALRAGACDVLDRPISDLMLIARIRSLIRQRDAATEMAFGGATWQALGMAEAVAGFVPAGRITVLSPRARALPQQLTALIDRLPGGAKVLDPDSDFRQDRDRAEAPDLFLLDGATPDSTGQEAALVLRLLSELRSNAITRHAATLVLIPEDQAAVGAMSYDLGADDLVTDRTSPDEMAHRVRSQLRRKSLSDQRRDSVQLGLRAAVTDPLTGLHNRRYAMPELRMLAERAQASGRGLAVMMLDIDHFKAINDSHGHAVGDIVLAEVARRLRSNLRAIDLIARVGGEEFLVAMPDTTLDQARGAAERLRRVIDGDPVEVLGTRAGKRLPLRLRVTLSIGVTCDPADLPREHLATDLTERADAALYAAKTEGRNKVMVAASAA
jgi:two-component system cell cycle response regulator